jgi:sugar phosphate permease
VPALADLKARFITYATTAFNLGGLVGTLLTVPAAVYLGRRRMFAVYFAVSAVAVWLVFSSEAGLSFDARLALFALVGVSLFGVFGAFTFYLPELFPPHIRGTGSGFCYNAARFVTAVGPFVVATVTAQAASTAVILDTVRWVALVPLFGCVMLAGGIGAARKTHQ